MEGTAVGQFSPSGFEAKSTSSHPFIMQHQHVVLRRTARRPSFLQLHRHREIQDVSWQSFARQNQMTRSLVSRLGIIKSLEGHRGCVNCIEFNSEGNLLLSGSDDYNIMLWDVYRQKKIKTLPTGHRGNIFSVKFLPQSEDRVVISGAGDGKIEVREVETAEVTQLCTCHCERVKRIATVPTLPNAFFSASEDGTVMLYDMRAPHTCNSQTNNVLINLRCHAGRSAECKCITINPIKPEELAVGASDPYIRIYDRRMIKLTSLQHPPGVTLQSQWERSNYATNQLSSSDNLPSGCVQYLVPGHLPDKLKEYYKRYRSLATTYLTYSADGTHLLANLGGEHIYLFNMTSPLHPRSYVPPSPPKLNSKDGDGLSNGVCKNISSNTNGISNRLSNGEKVSRRPPVLCPLPPRVETLKAAANKAFAAEKYITALQLYNQATQICPNSAVLYSNRAAALMKRRWEGDIYAALKDCFTALEIDPYHVKAHFRLAGCLHQLGREQEAQLCLNEFKRFHSDHSNSPACTALANEITTSLYQQDVKFTAGTSKGDSDDEQQLLGGPYPMPTPSPQEQEWRSRATDYHKSYCGHCNTTTDIKEAAFLGRDGQFIAAGSDDGNLFIWNRDSTNLVRVLPGDESIVNCVQPHPHTCLLATSGIESVVKLWAPLPQVDTESEANLDVEQVAQANQQRMVADPLEMMLLHMGSMAHGNLPHVFAGNSGGARGGPGYDSDDSPTGDPSPGGSNDRNVADVQCRTS